MTVKLAATMAQWDTTRTLYVMLPTGTEGQIIKEHAPGIQEVHFELYPDLTFLLEDEMIDYGS